MSGVICKKTEEIKKPVSSKGLHSNVAERIISFYKSRNIKHSTSVILSNRTLKLSIGTLLPISAKVSRNGKRRKSFSSLVRQFYGFGMVWRKRVFVYFCHA